MEKMTHDQAPRRGDDWSLSSLARKPEDFADSSRAPGHALGCHSFARVISSFFAPGRLLLQTKARTHPSLAGEEGARAGASKSSGPAVLIPAANTLHASRLLVSCARPRCRSAYLPGSRRLCRNPQLPRLDCSQACRVGTTTSVCQHMCLIDIAATGNSRRVRQRERDADLVGSPRLALPRKNFLREMVTAAPGVCGCDPMRSVVFF